MFHDKMWIVTEWVQEQRRQMDREGNKGNVLFTIFCEGTSTVLLGTESSLNTEQIFWGCKYYPTIYNTDPFAILVLFFLL